MNADVVCLVTVVEDNVNIFANGSQQLSPLTTTLNAQDVYQDRRLAVMLALMARCALDPEAFALYNLSEVINKQLSCEDMRGRYYAGENHTRI